MRLVALWLVSGCGAKSERIPPDGSDADADTDVDSDADSDVDSDTDTDTGIVPSDAYRPLEVCGLSAITRGVPTTLEVLTWGCEIFDCETIATPDGFDLRPTARPRDTDEDCAPGPYWIECEVPAVDRNDVAVSVWGEPLGVVSPCSDLDGPGGGCERGPDCFQLPPEPIGDCERQTLRATQACWPFVAPSHSDATVTATNGCGCPAEWIPAGAWVTETEIGPSFEVLVARCGDCGMEAVCQEVEGVAHLYDRWAGVETVTIEGGFGFSREVSIVDGALPGERICEEGTF